MAAVLAAVAAAVAAVAAALSHGRDGGATRSSCDLPCDRNVRALRCLHEKISFLIYSCEFINLWTVEVNLNHGLLIACLSTTILSSYIREKSFG